VGGIRASLLAVLLAPLSAPAAAELPPAKVSLTVVPGPTTWRVTIRNDGETPVRIPADERLLTLTITGTDPKKKPARCVLPDDIRPSGDEGSELVVPGQRSWSAMFDPAFHCWNVRNALVSGASVKPTFGWETRGKGKPSPPFAVSPVGASNGVVAPRKSLEASAFTLTDADAAPFVAPPKDPPPGVSLSMPASMDAARGVELSTVVSLRNGTDRRITLLYRPELLQFTVAGPGGTLDCGATKTIASPIRELFSTVAPKGRLDLTVLLTAICPAGTFDRPGVYRVQPKLDTRGASGRNLGIASWDDTVTGTVPLFVRVRAPRRPQPLPKPALD
jgi:hypothetical protein